MDFKGGRDSRHWILITGMFIIIIIVAIFSFIIMNLPSQEIYKNPQVNQNKTHVVDVNSSLYPEQQAVITGDVTKCDTYKEDDAKYSCIFSAKAKLNDTSICSNAEDNIKIIRFSSVEPGFINISLKDYCWITMTSTQKINYCRNIIDQKAMNLCNHLS